jgi:hypothetical protein
VTWLPFDPRPVRPHLGYTGMAALCSAVTNRLECTPDGPWIAGGCWLRLLGEGAITLGTGDVDVFCRDAEQVDSVCASLLQRGAEERYERTTWSRRFDFHGMTWNVITRPYESLEACLLDFDYTVCQWGWDGRSIFLGVCTDRDVKARELVPVKTRSAERQFNRICAYMQRGYSPSHQARDAMFAAVQEGRVKNEDGKDKDGGDYE